MRHSWKLALAGTILLVGCLPIELDVAKDGRVLIARQEGFFALDATGKVTKLYAPEAGNPVFARFSPDGKQILAVTESGGMMMGSGYEFAIVGADGKAKSVAKLGNATYALWSPDGQFVSVTRVADEKKAPLDEGMPELHRISVKDGSDSVLAANVADLHRWMPDSKSVLVFQIAKKEENNLYRGSLSLVDVTAGTSKALADVIGEKTVFYDLSSDGKTALFTARAAGKVGGELKAAEKTTMWSLSVADGAVKDLKVEAKYAVFSPDGKKVLVAGEEKDGLVTLQVGGPDLKELQKVTDQAAFSVSSGAMGSDTRIYPAWVGNDTVVFLTKTSVYGTAGKNLGLVKIGVDGKNAKNLQGAIDTAAMAK